MDPVSPAVHLVAATGATENFSAKKRPRRSAGTAFASCGHSFSSPLPETLKAIRREIRVSTVRMVERAAAVP